MIAIRLALVATIALVACNKRDEAANTQPPPIGESELTRAVAACSAYIEKLCACTTEAARAECKLAKLIPESIAIARRLALDPVAKPEDARQAASTIRATAKRCIDETAALPSVGCAP